MLYDVRVFYIDEVQNCIDVCDSLGLASQLRHAWREPFRLNLPPGHAYDILTS